MKYYLRELETSIHRTVRKIFDILNRVGVDYECDGQKDGRTDRQNGL